MRKSILVFATVQTVVIALVMAARLSCLPGQGKHWTTCPPLRERYKLSPGEWRQLLEQMGKLPDDAQDADYYYAKKTRWWGKRLDPRAFWRDKVVWRDEAACWDALRRGRRYPPIPYDMPEFARYSDKDYRELEWRKGTHTGFVASDRERVFWDNFHRTHPSPPDGMEHWQRDQAETWMRRKRESEREPPKYSPTALKRDLDAARSDLPYWVPPECVTEEAYYWAYVMKKREEYGRLLQLCATSDGRRISDGRIAEFVGGLLVDRKLVTEPLSADDIRAANAWKVAYLRRLRQEKTDSSYINAYLKAWHLSSNEVFGAPEQKSGE